MSKSSGIVVALRWMEQRRKRNQTLRAVTGLVVSVCLLAVLFNRRISRRHLSDDAPTTSTPNFMLIILDQWRYDWDGMYPDVPLRMPFLQRMAQRGIRFTQAFVPSPLCAPVRACLASGREYDEAGVLTNQANTFPLNQDTFYKLLRDGGGYHTMIVGKDDLYHHDPNFPYFPGSPYPPQPYDLGFSDARRIVSKTRVTKEVPPHFDLYRKHLEQLDDIEGLNAFNVYLDCFQGKMGGNDTSCRADTFQLDIYLDEFIHTQALDIMEQKPSSKPFFLQVNFAGPHPPNFIPSDMARSVQGRSWPDPIDNPAPHRWACPDFSGAPQYGGRCSYAAELEQLDHYLESLVSRVNLDDTVVCITGDHGEMLGDHNMGGKKVPYQPSVSVPLVCFGAGVVSTGQTYADPVTTLDLVGTVLELANVSPSPTMMVQSLWPTMSQGSTPSTRRVVHSGLGNWRLVVQRVGEEDDDASYKLVCCRGPCPHLPSGTPPPTGKWHVLLYNVDADHNDMNTLHESHPHIVQQMIPNLPEGWCRDVVSISG